MPFVSKQVSRHDTTSNFSHSNTPLRINIHLGPLQANDEYTSSALFAHEQNFKGLKRTTFPATTPVVIQRTASSTTHQLIADRSQDIDSPTPVKTRSSKGVLWIFNWKKFLSVALLTPTSNQVMSIWLWRSKKNHQSTSWIYAPRAVGQPPPHLPSYIPAISSTLRQLKLLHRTCSRVLGQSWFFK